jgi:uncharacterized protein
MWLLLSAVVTASLMGSLHCVGMCGPLAIWAAGVDRSTRSASIWFSTSLYHLGRGVTYALAGAIAGGLGQLLDWSGGAIGIQLMAARIVGVTMILLGSISIFRFVRPWLSQLWERHGSKSYLTDHSKATEVNAQLSQVYIAPKPDWITGQLLKLRPAIFGLPVGVRGLIVGLLTALLPCGWLYLFALLAAGTGSIQLGALVMAAFWLGSIPLLVGLIAGTRLLNGRARKLLPFAASILLVVAGAYTASGRGFASLAGGLKVSSVLVDQLKDGVQAESIDAATIQSGIDQLVTTQLPCCQARLSSQDSDNADSTAEPTAGSIVEGASR